MKGTRKRYFPKFFVVRRTCFFDVRETKASDYYLTITESKNLPMMMELSTTKHKIYLYKEDFNDFSSILNEMVDFIIKERGEEVISERHQKATKRKKF